MKFLIALSVLASTTVFAQQSEWRKIKCYEPAQQGGDAEVAYVFLASKYEIKLVYPDQQELALNNYGCLAYPEVSGKDDGYRKFCLSEGQHVNGFVPVTAQNGVEEEVYCQREIKRYFEPDMM